MLKTSGRLALLSVAEICTQRPDDLMFATRLASCDWTSTKFNHSICPSPQSCHESSVHPVIRAIVCDLRQEVIFVRECRPSVPTTVLTMAPKQLHSTFPKLTPRGSIHHNAKPVPLAKELKEQLQKKNMEGYYVGPMDPTQFMNSFMSINSQNFGSSPDNVDLSKVYKQTNERLMYELFVSCFIALW